MSERKRKNFTSQYYKSKVVVEAIRGVKTVNEIAKEFGVHPTQVGEWSESSSRRRPAFSRLSVDRSPSIRRPVRSVLLRDRRLKMELDWLKKVRDRPIADRKQWVSLLDPMALSWQCALAGVARSAINAPRMDAVPDDLELLLLTLTDAEYTRHPFYGSRRMVVHLGKAGHMVNRKRVQRLMGFLGLAGMAPGPIPATLTLSTRFIRICTEA